jgi:hypothetical protein
VSTNINIKHFNLNDATLFVKKVGKTIVCLVVYVDYILITWTMKHILHP